MLYFLCCPKTPILPVGGGGEGGGRTPMKRVGMLMVSLRGVNFGFWSHLRSSGQNAIICGREGLLEGCTRRPFKSIYLICLLLWSLVGDKKACVMPRLVSFRGLIQNFP